MAVDAPDPVAAALKKLREGRGLSTDRLADHPDLLSALGSQHPGEAMETLLQAIHGLGAGEQANALRVDFGMGLAEAFGREPVGREIDWLGDRRTAYSDVVGRDVRTVRRWSDRALEELRGLLITDFFDGHILMTVGVRDHRVETISVMRYQKDDTDYTHGQHDGFTNPSEGSGPPLVLYTFPPEWRPASLNFLIQFLGARDTWPTEVNAVVAKTIIDMGFGQEKTALSIDEGGLVRCKVEAPIWDRVYGAWWG